MSERRRDHAPVRPRERRNSKDHEIAQLRESLEECFARVGSAKHQLAESVRKSNELRAAIGTITNTARHCVQALHPEPGLATPTPRNEGDEALYWVGELCRQFSLLWWQNLALGEDVKRLEGGREIEGEGPKGEGERPALSLSAEREAQTGGGGWQGSVGVRPGGENEGTPSSPAAEREAREREMLSWMKDDDYTTSAMDGATSAIDTTVALNRRFSG